MPPKRKFQSAKTQYYDSESESAEESELEPNDADARNAAQTSEPEDDQDMDEQDQEAEEDEINQDVDIEPEAEDDDDSEEQPTPAQPRLRIKLKIPTYTPSASNSATPALEEDPEEEEDDEVEDDGEEEVTRSSRLTTRQAVLASVVDSSHVALSNDSRKKKALNETELALRREETARKRKNLSEKRLEDEKMETINRLLKKQTRTRNNNKRSAIATPEDNTPGLGDDEAEVDVTPETPPPPPMTYRWVSSIREDGNEQGGLGERVMQLSFSVPYAAFPEALRPSEPEEDKMDVDKPPPVPIPPVLELPKSRPRCAVDGCGEVMKYRLPAKWTIGACGMAHLNVLRSTFQTTAAAAKAS